MKVVFFVFDPSPRIDRRIKEFVKNGYSVDVYGFANDINIKYCTSTEYVYNKIADMGPGMSYGKRFQNIKLINKIISKYDRKTTLFYFFTLNVAIAALFNKGIKYVYEESDMLFDRFKRKLQRQSCIYINKIIIKNSKLTVFTSEGFGKFYFGDKIPSNICVVPNRVSEECLSLPNVEKNNTDISRLRIGFVGNIRYKEILNISRVVTTEFPDFEFHYFGNTEGLPKESKEELARQGNKVKLHGLFKNPQDLPSIYATLDVVVCTYDVKSVNPQYAEPNKLYEALFYRTPMMVSSNSFLAEKVEKMGIGFSVCADNDEDIKNKLLSLSEERYNLFIRNLYKVPRESAVSINDHLFERINNL